MTLVVRLLHNAPPGDPRPIVDWLGKQAVRFMAFPRLNYSAFVLEYLDMRRDAFGPLSPEAAKALGELRAKLGKDSRAGVEYYLKDPENN